MIKFKKINLVKNEHLLLNNNWRFISNKLQIFHNKKGINCYEWLDKELKQKNIKDQWMGFLHNPIAYPNKEYPEKYKNKTLPLSSLVQDVYFLDKLNSCSGIFVFTNQIKKFIQEATGFNKLQCLIHPSPDFIFEKKWEFNNKLNFLHVGQQLRRYHSFLKLQLENKIILNPPNCNGDLIEMTKYQKNNDCIILPNCSVVDYLNLLCSSVVFLDLYDVAACNVIIECIVLNVPILINKIKGCVEYLGESYPFYFDTLEEAQNKAMNKRLILETHEYLKKINKNKFTLKYFLKTIHHSEIFKGI